jgi:orotate phosphoribosyltransferase
MAHASTFAHERTGQPMVRAFTVRKQAKQHGTGRLIEGPFVSGDRVVVVEDVITTGGSALTAVEAIRAAGGEVLGVLALVDREEGGREALESAGLTVRSLALASELVARLPQAS